MAFCVKCGATLNEGSAFCTGCGSPASGENASAQAASAAAPASTSTGMTPNVAGALAYILGLLTGIVFLVVDPYKNDKFVRFHAFQSIFFNVAWIALWIILSILGSILSFATAGIGALILLPLGGLVALVFVILWLYLMYKAYRNERFMLPVIGELAVKQSG